MRGYIIGALVGILIVVCTVSTLRDISKAVREQNAEVAAKDAIEAQMQANERQAALELVKVQIKWYQQRVRTP